jgi:putative ABC transport system permease protein
MRWIRHLLRKSRTESQLDKELRFHLDQQIANHIAEGVSPKEALRRARLEFGGLERVKEEVRDTRWETHLDNAFRDFRYAIRNLRKERRFALIAIFALALGIGASTVVFSVFYNLLFNAFAAKDASRLVVPVVQNAETSGDIRPLNSNLTDLKFIREQNQVFENIVGSQSAMLQLRDGPQTYQLYNAPVTSDAFEFYGVPALLGRSIAPEDGKPGAAPVFVMSYKTWKGEFNATPQILGKTFTLDGEPHTLVGVMPPRFHAYGILPELWTPIPWARSTSGSDPEPKLNLLARLKPGVSIENASADLDVIVKHLALLHPDDYPKRFSVRALSATDYLMGPSGLGVVFNSGIQLKNILYDLLVAVMVLLLIACSNVANLLLARATVREKEIAVRSALGATSSRIIRQLLTESFVLAITSCLVGCVFAWVGMKGVEAVIHQKAWARIAAETVVGLNPPVLLFALSLTFLTTLICGLAPALHVRHRDLLPHLVGDGKGVIANSGHGNLRAGLVIGQVALSIVLLIGAGLMMRSLFLLTHIDLGFNPQNILVVGFAPPRGRTGLPDRANLASPEGQVRFQRILERLKAIPGVAAVAVNNTIPGYGPSRGPQMTVPGGTRVEEAGLDECDEYCAQTLGLRLIQGRWLSGEDVQTDQFVAVINQRLAHDFFGDRNPVGQQLEVKGFDQWKGALRKTFALKPSQPPQDATLQIVGVVGDVKNAGPQQPAVPMAFIPPLITGKFILQVKTNVEPGSLKHAVQEQVWAVDRAEIFWVFDPLEDFLQEHTYATPEFGVMLSAPLAGIAVLLVVIGVFSVMDYTVSLQTHEIGIRVALGAQQRDILSMVLRKGVVLVLIGAVIGMLTSFGLTRFLAGQIWNVSATDLFTFCAVLMGILAVGVAACFFPARRAAALDPLVALRYE